MHLVVVVEMLIRVGWEVEKEEDGSRFVKSSRPLVARVMRVKRQIDEKECRTSGIILLGSGCWQPSGGHVRITVEAAPDELHAAPHDLEEPGTLPNVNVVATALMDGQKPRKALHFASRTKSRSIANDCA